MRGLPRRESILSAADFILGTSAGAFVGARLAMGASPADLAAPFLVMDQSKPLPRASGSSAAAPAKAPDLAPLMRMMVEASSGTRPAQEVRAEIGAWALAAETMTEEAFITSFGRALSELPADAWPKRGYACTAVDAGDGAFKLWTRESRVGLARAVASSCSVPGIYPPITIDCRHYIDGGMRSGTNADMAKGYDLVVVVAIRAAAPGGLAAERALMTLEGELETLRAAGARVELIVPDAASLEALGTNLMDARRRPGAAAAGYALGKSGPGPEALRAVWAG